MKNMNEASMILGVKIIRKGDNITILRTIDCKTS